MSSRVLQQVQALILRAPLFGARLEGWAACSVDGSKGGLDPDPTTDAGRLPLPLGEGWGEGPPLGKIADGASLTLSLSPREEGTAIATTQ
jgi:hypothetical protein